MPKRKKMPYAIFVRFSQYCYVPVGCNLNFTEVCLESKVVNIQYLGKNYWVSTGQPSYVIVDVQYTHPVKTGLSYKTVLVFVKNV